MSVKHFLCEHRNKVIVSIVAGLVWAVASVSYEYSVRGGDIDETRLLIYSVIAPLLCSLIVFLALLLLGAVLASGKKQTRR